jgi:DNA-binding NarL/FixJ family response regulator
MKIATFKEMILIAMLLAVTGINTMDFIKDIYHGDEWLHIGLEVLTVGLCIGGIIMLIRMMFHRAHVFSQLSRKVEEANNNLMLIRSKLKEIGREYSKYVREQFAAWNLTHSEQEVALMLLKGLSFKEIADIRKTQEKTVRQQASAIYGKSSVAGRHEFSAWFFEDMLI